MLVTHPFSSKSSGTDNSQSQLSPQSRGLHAEIVALLRSMVASKVQTPLDARFREQHRELLSLLARFQAAVLESERRQPSCARGCRQCCFHWVEDVNSFEAEILADHLRTSHADRVPEIVDACRADVEAMEELQPFVDQRMRETREEREREGAAFDDVDVLLGCFYQLGRPCPLLGADGACLAYELRPITCRIYVSFSEPEQCSPDVISGGAVPTVLLDLEEEANALLDKLHFKFDVSDGDSGLRSLLLTRLSAPHVS
jgi:Fe-S-cluster containining protein